MAVHATGGRGIVECNWGGGGGGGQYGKQGFMNLGGNDYVIHMCIGL